jgi:formate C-acetyltransferase
VGDNICIRQMLVDGRSLEQARNYVIIGCTSPSVPGQSFDFLHTALVAPVVLEMALHDGRNPITGAQGGPHTGDPRTFTTYEQLWDAFAVQVKAAMEVARLRGNLELKNFGQLAPNPFQSVLSPVCFERGEDILQGGTAPQITLACSTGGIVNVADALAALKKLVYEDKRVTMDQMLAACEADFVGYEDVLSLIEQCPKFGNDDEYVDSICNDVLAVLDETPPEHHMINGGKPTVCGSIVTGTVPCGQIMGAQPDGRRAGTPLAEGGLSPHQGRNVSGITAPPCCRWQSWTTPICATGRYSICASTRTA